MEVGLELTAGFKYTSVHILFSVLSSLREVARGRGIEIVVEVGTSGVKQPQLRCFVRTVLLNFKGFRVISNPYGILL